MLPGRTTLSPLGQFACKAMFCERSENSLVRIGPREFSRADATSKPLKATLAPLGLPSRIFERPMNSAT